MGMGRRKHKNKKIRIILYTAIFLIVGGFFANWYLKYRLENYLRETLRNEVSKASDGFYNLDFGKLSIGLFDGSLYLEGIHLHPDSTTFDQWQTKDSLPDTYFKIDVHSIHFDGINLTWRFDYKKLNFKLFEIKHPDVEVFSTKSADLQDQKEKSTTNISLYDFIAPYIDVLTVKQMNLENASISYSVIDGVNTSMYALKDVSFHAHGFKLDADSHYSGKLLFCDNFDFITHQPQMLLSNNQFVFNIDKIELNTQDSIVSIENINILPRKDLWEENNQVPDSYLESSMKLFQLKGIEFFRKQSLSNLKARLFEIEGSDISYHKQKKQKEKKSQHRQDSVNINIEWTLYEIVSPVLNSINIDKIGVNNARLKYTESTDTIRDTYTLNNFNFEAYNFRVDSLADREQKFLYSDDFAVDARGIEGIVNSKNEQVNVGQMYYSTIKGLFQVKDIALAPISTNTKYDYLTGSVDSITMTGIVYQKGIHAQRFAIDAPRVEYVKMPSKKRSAEIEEVVTDDPLRNLDVVTPFFDHLSIESVELKDGNITLNDKSVRGGIVYHLPKVDFLASNVLVNEETISKAGTYFTCDDFSFRFERFDNLLPGKEYRLKIKSGLLSGMNGRLFLRGVDLIPQVKTWAKAPDTYVSFSSPMIDLRKFDYQSVNDRHKVTVGSFDIKSPLVKVFKTRNTESGPKSSKNPNEYFDIRLNTLNIPEVRFFYVDQQKKDTLEVFDHETKVNHLTWNSQSGISIGEVKLQSPRVRLKQSGIKTSAKNTKNATQKVPLKVDQIFLSDAQINIEQPKVKLHFDSEAIGLSQIAWTRSALSLGSFSMDKSNFKIHEIITTQSENAAKAEKQGDIYTALKDIATQFSVGKFDISESVISYSNTLNGKSNVDQTLNRTSLHFSGLEVDTEKKDLVLDDFEFKTKDLYFPLDNGFYTLIVGDVELSKQREFLLLNNIHLKASYPKMEFAYHHPKHKDWFDVKVNKVAISGIDFPTYFENKKLQAKDLRVEDVVLLNFKNQKIEIEHNVMPLIYEGLHKLPIPFLIDSLNVKNFSVVYEELAKNGTIPGRISFTRLNGQIAGFTNVASSFDQYNDLHADGWLMDKGYFKARWQMPVDVTNDHFKLSAHLKNFDLTELNQLITPLAPVKVENGKLQDLTFATDASSKGATVDMTFLYNGLKLGVLKDHDGQMVENKLVSRAANMVLKRDNPDIKRGRKKKPRVIHTEVIRDPYHSTFNYFWQILQPPLVESVGISPKKQGFAKRVVNIMGKVKNTFKKKPKEKVLEP